MQVTNIVESSSPDLWMARKNVHLEGNSNPVVLTMVDVNAKREDGSTALVLACCDGHLKIVEALLHQKEVDVNAVGRHGITPLIGASGNGHFDIVVKLLNHVALKGEVQDDDNTVASIANVEVFNSDVIGWDLMGSVRMDVKTEADGLAYLHTPSGQGCLEGADQYRMQQKVNVNAKNDDGSTALMMASSNGHVQVVCELLACKDLDVLTDNIEGDTCVSMATRNGHSDVVCELQKHENIDASSD